MRRTSLIISLLCVVLTVEANLPKDRKIIVIGAGPAGLAAISKLLENGYKNVLLLEASDRIGGRINSTKFGDGFVDLGAQWIHGRNGSIIFEMVKDTDLYDITPDSFWIGMHISSNGERREEYGVLSNISRQIFYEEKDLCTFVPNKSYGEFFDER